MDFLESIKQAFISVKSNKLRAGLTLLSIAIGVFAIIISMSLVSSIDNTINSQLEELGENSFYIYKMPKMVMSGGHWRKYARRKPITYSSVNYLKREMKSTPYISGYGVSMGNTVNYGNLETNPNVNLFGVDSEYFTVNNISMEDGRPLTIDDVNFNRKLCVIGNDVSVILFPNENPIGKKIKIKSQYFTVIGTLTPKGALMGQSQDNNVLIPVTQFLQYYSEEQEESLIISMKALGKDKLESSMDEAIGLMRIERNLKPWEENTFEIETNESIAEQFAGLTDFMTYFGLICGIIAIIAAGVGIMNIMLVTVKERTREIGIRKAIGAKRSSIMMQFIIETITLCQMGGFIGIIFGVGVGSAFGAMMGLTFTIPVTWVIISIVICTILGLVFGAYPASKASKLDPIEALRYE